MGSLVRAVTEATCVLQLQTGRRMLSLRSCLMCCFVLALLLQPVPAPFPPGDPRAFLNPFIEPWWCRVPKIMREYLHLKFTFSPLNENGPCRINGYSLEHRGTALHSV